MKKRKMGRQMEKIISIFIIGIMVLSLVPVSAAEVFAAGTTSTTTTTTTTTTSAATSAASTGSTPQTSFSNPASAGISSVQTSSPVFSSESFGTSYNSLMSGPSITNYGANLDESSFDLMVMIPPGGCQPSVVRSDLLEEQDVPVFCKVVSAKINPSVDISRIGKINFKMRGQNQYISGIGFYPAQAAIRSTGRLISTPINSNLGYVIVVLKRQANESGMPSNVTAMLSAVLQYDTESSFGIGQTEFYLPEMLESDFQNDHSAYGFWNGMGYLRAEEVSDTGATVSIYAYDMRKVYSTTLAEGKTSDEIYIPTNVGGKAIKLVLKDTSIPEVSARIKVDNDEYNVYRGERFGEGCYVSNLEAYGAGTGYATISCSGERTFTLQKNFGSVRLAVSSSGETTAEVGKLVAGTDGIYLNYVGTLPKESTASSSRVKQYAILVERQANDKTLTENQMFNIRRDISQKLLKIKQDKEFRANLAKIKPYSAGDLKVKYGVIFSDDSLDYKGVRFESGAGDNIERINAELGNAAEYYNAANKAYDEIINDYASEKILDTTYEQQALCDKFLLATELRQEQAAREILIELADKYPNTYCGTKDVSDWLEENNVLTSKGATYAGEKGSYYELVSVNEPSAEDASVSIKYTHSQGAKETIIQADLRKGAENKLPLANDESVILQDFDKEGATISYTCKKVDGTGGTYTSTRKIPEGGYLDMGSSAETGGAAVCSSRLVIEKINLKKVAKVRVTPMNAGKSSETNFTFNIGIEKRASALALSPAQAQSKIAKLNESIKDFQKINKNLGKVVEGMKGACLATTLALQVKTLVTGFSGAGLARERVMTDTWNKNCGDKVFWTSDGRSYNSFNSCILGEASNIEKDVAAMQKAMKEVNANVQAAEKGLSTTKFFTTIIKPEAEGVYLSRLQNAYGSKSRYGQTYAWIDLITVDDLSYEELRDVELAIAVGATNEASASLKASAEKDLEDYAQKVKTLHKEAADRKAAEEAAGKKIEVGDRVKDQNGKQGIVKELQNSGGAMVLWESKNVAELVADTSTLKKIVTSAEHIGCGYPITNAEGVDGTGAQFFDSAPYKGMPSLLPFDKAEGWYLKISQEVPGLGQTKSYASSGMPEAATICCVGSDGKVGTSDDDCQGIDFNKPETYRTIMSVSGNNIATKAKAAIKKAQSEIAKNPSATSISINGMKLNVKNVAGSTLTRCTDFMSARDCQILFNLCDPVVCPTSRCNFGGKFTVDDVIQSGVIGSITLCLPNFKEGVIIPVCLTGIHAGVESWTSILTNYRDCLQEKVNTGKMVGLCDEIYSVYVCDFFWKQLAPYLSVLTENIISWALEQNKRGGGEYLFVKDAFARAENSWKQFVGRYMEKSKLGFISAGFAELGSEVCKMQLSATYPDKIKASLSPESPYQINAWFQENQYTDATVPPSSQYKVFYHIYAGNDTGLSYRVYLTSPASYESTSVKSQIIVAQGYLQQGGYASESRDFLDTAGYKKLCVRINTRDYCDFKSVSTSFALNYAKDAVIKEQTTSGVTSEKECTSGTPTIGSALVTPNIQQGIEDAISPNLYNQGVVRICATRNPAKGTGDESRWKDVGYCNDEKTRCWVDEESVKNSIKGEGVESATVDDINKLDAIARAKAQDKTDYLTEEAANEEINKLKKEYGGKWVKSVTAEKQVSDAGRLGLANLEKRADELKSRIIYNHQRAALLLFQARVYRDIAIAVKPAVPFVEKPETPEKTAGAAAKAEKGVGVSETFKINYDGAPAVDYRYNYDKKVWEYKGLLGVISGWTDVSKMGDLYGQNNKNLAKALTGKDYVSGFNVLDGILKTDKSKIQNADELAGAIEEEKTKLAESGGAAAAGSGTTTAPMPADNSWTIEDTAIFCGYLDVAGLVVGAITKPIIDSSLKAVSLAMQTFDDATEVMLEYDTAVIDNSIYKRQLTIRNMNKISYAVNKETGEIVGQFTNDGKFMQVPTKTIKYQLVSSGVSSEIKVAKDAVGTKPLKWLSVSGKANLVSVATEKVVGTVDDTTALLAKRQGDVLKAISGTSKYAKVFSKIAKVSLITAVVSSICFIGALSYIAFSADRAGAVMEKTAQEADEQIAKTIDTLHKNTDILAANSDSLKNKLDAIALELPELAALLNANFNSINERIKGAVSIDTRLSEDYAYFYNHDDGGEQSGGILFWRKGSKFSQKEHNTLWDEVQELRKAFVEIQTDLDSLATKITEYMDTGILPEEESTSASETPTSSFGGGETEGSGATVSW